MDAETACEQLSVRYFQLALEDFQREIDQGFPYLRTVTDRRVQFWIVIFEGLANEQKQTLSRALVKKQFYQIAERMGNPYTHEDEIIYEQFFAHVIRMPMLPRETPDPSKGDITPINLRRLASRIIERLNPILGDQLERFNEMEWAYVTPMGDWSVKTRVSIYNPRKPEIRYEHRVGRTDYTWRPVWAWLEPRFSFARNLGLGENVWRVDYEYELEPVAESLATLCAHFIDAFPRLVQGISPNEAIAVSPISNNDLLSQYTGEQVELIREIHHALEEDDRVNAAWISVPNGSHFADLVSIAVSDREYEALSASMGQRVRFIQSMGSTPILLSSYFDPRMWEIHATEVVIVYSGQVGPHSINYRWWPLSIAAIPTEGHRILFNKVGLPRTDQHVRRNNANIKHRTTPDERILQIANWFWAALVMEVAASIRGHNEPLEWAWTALIELEESLSLPVTSEEERVATSTISHNLTMARQLAARGAFLTDQLRLKEIDAPSADIFDNMNRLIDLVGEVTGSQSESLALI